MSLKRTVEPATEPVDLADLQRQARVGDSHEDVLSLQAYITAAREYVELYTMRSLITQTWQLSIDSAFPTSIYLRRPPVQSISSITYTDKDGAEQTLDSSLYQADLNAEPALVQVAYSATWPTTRKALSAVKVTYVAGYGNTALSVPMPIRQAILMLATTMFDSRGADGADWGAVSNLLEAYRVLEVV